MGGSRRVICSGADGRRDEDDMVDGGDGLQVNDGITKENMFLYSLQVMNGKILPVQ